MGKGEKANPYQGQSEGRKDWEANEYQILV